MPGDLSVGRFFPSVARIFVIILGLYHLFLLFLVVGWCFGCGNFYTAVVFTLLCFFIPLVFCLLLLISVETYFTHFTEVYVVCLGAQSLPVFSFFNSAFARFVGFVYTSCVCLSFVFHYPHHLHFLALLREELPSSPSSCRRVRSCGRSQSESCRCSDAWK